MNKLKGSSDAIRIKHLIIIFAVSLLVALPTRTYQLLALVNHENGFFENGDFTVPVLYGLIAVFTILILVLSFLCKDIPSPKINTGKNPVLAIASLLMTGGFVWDIILTERKIVPQISSYVSVDVFRNLFSVYLKENGGIFLVLQFVFAVLGVFWSLIFAASYFEGKPYYKKFPILALSPLGWCMSVLVSKLMKPISFITVSELLFEIFMMVFAMLFFITFARISTGVFTENSMWGIFGYGLATAFFGAVVTIPRLVILFAGLNAVEGNEFSFTHLAIFIFSVVFILSVIGVGFKHGLKNIQSVQDLELPDDEDVVVKGSDIAYVTEIADDEITYAEDVYEENISEEGFAIDEAMDKYLNEIDADIISETVEEITEEPVVEDVEEIAEEPVVEYVKEIAENPVVEDVEEIAEEPVVEDIEEIAEEPVVEDVEEIAEEPVIEVVEEIAEEPVVEETTTEDVSVTNIKNGEDFVDFSEMLIEDIEDVEQIKPEKESKKSRPKKEKYPVKEKKVKEKKKEQKQVKQKKSASKKKDDDEEVIKIVSLADLNKDKDSK